MYLITKWFGTFLFDGKKIEDKIIFPKKRDEIYKRLEKIKNNKILDEEKTILKDIKKDDIIVNEKRLSNVGNLDIYNSFFQKVKIDPNDYNFTNKMIQTISLNFVKKEVNDYLESTDLQIVQMINTLDDFIHIQNLLNERYNTWSEIKISKKRMKPLINTISNLKNDIKNIEEKIIEDINDIAPNLTKLVGPLISARLISYAGGLKELALFPSSTIQVLGAEKALFRFKKLGGKPPKHGIIFQLKEINKAPKSNRGKIARNIANKISIAARADAFTKRDISVKLKEEIDKRVNEIRNL